MKNMKKVLVTGANGYVGKHVLAELKRQGYVSVALVYSKTPDSQILVDADKIIKGDVLDKPSIENAARGVDAVIHLVAAMRKKEKNINYNINLTGTKNVIEVCEKLGIKRIVYTSSVSALKKKRGHYGESKLQAEKALEESGLEYTIFRPTIIYGLEGKGINNIIEFTLKFPLFIPLVGSGRWTRKPKSVHDVARALVEVLDNEKTYRKAYPLAGTESVEFRELVDIVAEALGLRKVKIPIPVPICHLGAWILERLMANPPLISENVVSLSQNTEMDISEFLEDTGFQPSVDLKTGITALIAEMRTNNLI